MLSFTQPSTSGSPLASTDPLDHAVEELLVSGRWSRLGADGQAGEPRRMPVLAPSSAARSCVGH